MCDLTIILATASSEAVVAPTLASLRETVSGSALSIEVLLVENAPIPSLGKLALGPVCASAEIRYLHEATPGKSRALNCALRHARGRVLLFTDDDLRFPAGWLERMAAPILSGAAMAVAGGVRLAPHLLRPWMNRTHRAWLASTGDYLSPTAPSEMCGANMAVDRRVFDRIGGFDPELGPGVTNGGEESLLSWQIKECGWRIEPAFDVEVEHHLNPDRLKYQHWLTAAKLSGWSRAYLRHHWFHEPIENPRRTWLLLRSKLLLRRRITPRPGPDDAGIAPWELSYVEEIAACARYMRERRRPRNYTHRGLQKLCAAPTIHS
jgi:glycosyltransferase involved in cell wall biosynthesis